MVNHYTVAKHRRPKDFYSPGGKMGLRPDHADVVYGNLIRRTCKHVPIVLGGGVMKQTQLFPLVRKKALEDLAGYLVTPELADIDSYIVEAGCKGDQGVLGCIELGRRALESVRG